MKRYVGMPTFDLNYRLQMNYEKFKRRPHQIFKRYKFYDSQCIFCIIYASPDLY